MRKQVEKRFKEQGLIVENIGIKQELSRYSCTATTRSMSWVTVSLDKIMDSTGTHLYNYKDTVCGYSPIYMLFDLNGKRLIYEKTQRDFFKKFDELEESK